MHFGSSMSAIPLLPELYPMKRVLGFAWVTVFHPVPQLCPLPPFERALLANILKK